MKAIRQEKLNTLIEKIKESYGSVDTKLVKFIEFLESYGFLLNIPNEEINWCLENDANYFSLPTLKNSNISIGLSSIYNGKTIVGVDPTFCFNKIGDCSILAYFPMSKREFDRFMRLMEKLVNVKKINKDYWFNVAKESWCGSYVEFGR